MSKKQIEMYRILLEFKKENNKSPTLRELSQITGKARSTLCELLQRMEQKGYLKLGKGKKREIILEENKYDEYIYFCEDDIEEEENVKYRSSKGNKQGRGSIWNKK